ncbi:hypothetical protein B0G84_8558 [Paraburkholderia sp. BL8N3]|nr:hypothetical protein [Paraburkholderia sp. BL8N3]TCK32705.1 hypothetical protein B0G84_8558 [Paraburkholderia sp. BL8N3]
MVDDGDEYDATKLFCVNHTRFFFAILETSTFCMAGSQRWYWRPPALRLAVFLRFIASSVLFSSSESFEEGDRKFAICFATRLVGSH